MYNSPSRLGDKPRRKLAEALNNVLADGLDLHSQIKVAHWNIKGPHFAALHPLFDGFATDLAGYNDEVAERAVTLGGQALGTARHVAKHSRLDEYPQETTRDLDHVQLLADRIDVYLDSLREARAAAHKHEDEDTVDMLTGMIEVFEKHGWFLRSTLDG